MKEGTEKLKKMVNSRKNQKIIYKNTGKKIVSLFVDDLSTK